MNKLYKELYDLIEVILDNEKKGQEEFSRWDLSHGNVDPFIEQSWHFLSHYFADEDIMERDFDYAKDMRNELMNIREASRLKYQ
ncbi:hypothetical protein SAMN02745181_0260 [Rubritalea squalenifaciens DSM 18772]|uniref:Uncharacterized protein n=1 Tax=Rubritalea squalenifaciens DSM 18772 TaxID=1123071 RepID=A0A1M6BMF1_9BACT|nr:hypothetical protein [Rubritalea squalenifaciens]SHI49874.1 hypothetical protein SAMN02745181_0260 [Rubritalea squalenifaciens DSM 18772]